MTDKKTNPLWNILKSLKLTLILLSILVIVSIIGTIIQQEDAGLYHSLWFRLIIFCLSINLIVCSIDRFPVTLKMFRLTPNPDRSKVFEDGTPRTILVSNTGVERVSSAIQESLKGRFKNLVVKENGNESFIYCDKGRFSLFSVYLVHLSVLFILAGAILGSIFGFKANVNIPEGGSVNSVEISKGTLHGHKDLGFSVQCKKFMVDFYANGSPKEYRSDLGFIVNGQEALSGSLRVNHPIKFMGVTFYQSSYGTVPGKKVRLKVINAENKDEKTTVDVELEKSVMLPDNKGEVTLSDIRDDFMNLGSAVLITIKSPEGQETPIWLFQDKASIPENYSAMFELSPKFNPSAYKPFTFSIEDMGAIPFTGLQVSRDPGVKFVFIGFVMIMVGLFFTFFTSQRKFWIRVAGEKGDVKISLAGTANKNPIGMERELDRLLLRIKRITGEGNHNG